MEVEGGRWKSKSMSIIMENGLSETWNKPKNELFGILNSFAIII